MKAMLLAFALTVVIAVGAFYSLQEIGFSAEDQTSGADVRLDE
ncbi:MAG: hypothetical protein ABJI96_07930 [Paracoccaceae bacterium]